MCAIGSGACDVEASNTDSGDELGWAVQISRAGDGSAVGAVGEASDATGIDGDELSNAASWSGVVYLRRSGERCAFERLSPAKASSRTGV